MSHPSRYLVSSRSGLHKVSPHCLNLPLVATSVLSQVGTACSARFHCPHAALRQLPPSRARCTVGL